MTEPKLNEYILPVFKLFEDSKEHPYSEIGLHLSTTTDLSNRDRPRRAQVMINNSIGYLMKALLLSKVADKTFRITDRGKQLLQTSPQNISVKDLRNYKEFEAFIVGRYKQVSPIAPPSEISADPPEEQIESAYRIYESALAAELLEKVNKCTWQFFEILVMDLLVKMGYGDPFDEARLTKGPGDEGIDGVIKEDKLGLDTICLQAKKWENIVGRPEVQKFVGSLESKRAKKGVFITTSAFSQEAHEYVRQIEKRIILIDGVRLSELMIAYGVGVDNFKTYTLKKIDTDYFDG